MSVKLKDKEKYCYGIENFEYGIGKFAVYDNSGRLLKFRREIEG